MGLAGDIVMVVVVAFFAGALARFLKLPLLLGYIVAGILVGPNTGGFTVTALDDLETLADIGVALLLFAVGLEFSLGKLRLVAAVAVGGTALQLGLSVAMGWLVAHWWGWNAVQALWFGCMISLSSTMVAMKLFTDWGYADTLSGRVVLSMLVAQDLAAIPMMVLLPDLSKPGGAGGGELTRSLLMVLLVVALMLSFGAWVLPRLLAQVARLRSRELFLVAVMGVGLGIGYLTYKLGLSFAFGAFLAGLVLSESDFSHHALGTIEPLRDLFGMLFFASVGMLLQLDYLWTHWPLVLGLLVAVMVFKGLIFAGVVRLFGYRRVVPIAVGLGLSQIGEFSFVMAREGMESGALAPDLYKMTLLLTTLSMVLTPLVAGMTGPVYSWVRRRWPDSLDIPEPEALPPSQSHVVVAGYGRLGGFVCRLLRMQGRNCRIVELDWERYLAARAGGFEAVYGDMTQHAAAEAVDLRHAEIVILAMSDPTQLFLTVDAIHRNYPSVPIVSRAGSVRQLEELVRVGASEVVLPELEAGLELARQALLCLDSDPAQVLQHIDEVRRSHYKLEA